MFISPTRVYTDEIFEYVEQALSDYPFLPRLAHNPLTHLLNLSAFRANLSNGAAGDGWALRRALDAAIDAIVGDDMAHVGNGRVRTERYLHWRWRERLTVTEIAGRLNYSDRQLQRLRDDLTRQVSEMLLAITRE